MGMLMRWVAIRRARDTEDLNMSAWTGKTSGYNYPFTSRNIRFIARTAHTPPPALRRNIFARDKRDDKRQPQVVMMMQRVDPCGRWKRTGIRLGMDGDFQYRGLAACGVRQ
jgi:hypothetical protein